MCRLAGRETIGFEHAESALRVLAGDAGGFDAPAVRVEREPSALVLTCRPPGIRGRWQQPANLFEYSLSIPGEVALPEAGWIVSAESAGRAAGFDSSAILGRNGVAVVRGDACGGALVVRNRRPGDRFRPAEVGRMRKLQDFFVDKKVARQKRDGVPIVAAENGRIIWVAGYAIDHAFRVTDPAQGVLILRLRQLGGSA
jgi:tRNA(Ile)-lysidine synthase